MSDKYSIKRNNRGQEENKAHLKYVITLLCVTFEIDDLAINVLKFLLY